MSKPKRSRKSTRFVPRLVVGVSLVAVVPACAGCTGPSMGVADVGFAHDVAADTFVVRPDAPFGVADVSFDAGHSVAADAFAVADRGFSVADVTFDVGPTVAADAFSVADSGFSVADTGFGGPG